MNTYTRSYDQNSLYFHWIQFHLKLSHIQSFPTLQTQLMVKCQVQSFYKSSFQKNTQKQGQNQKILLLLKGNFIYVKSLVNNRIIDCIQCNRHLKFQMIYSNLNSSYQLEGIKFSHNGAQEQSVVFLINNLQINALQKFKDHLQKQYVVQGGFHQNFKAKRKLQQTQYHCIYRAQNRIDKKQYAIKSFQKETYFSREDCDGKQKFENYFKSHAQLMKCYHPSFVRFYGVFQTLNSIYIKLQVLGCQFEKYLKQTIFQKKYLEQKISQIVLTKILKLFLKIVQGISHLHQNKFIHRSLSIESIMIRKNQNSLQGQLKHQPVIIDFSRIKKYEKKQQFTYQMFLGVEGYVAPQVFQMQMEDITFQRLIKADVYSLGCILYYMIYQKLSSKGKNFDQIEQKLQDDENQEKMIDKSSQILLKKMKTLLKKCLQKNPQLRISSKELVFQIKSLLEEQKDKIATTQQIQLVGDNIILSKKQKKQLFLLQQQDENSGLQNQIDKIRKKVKKSNNFNNNLYY